MRYYIHKLNKQAKRDTMLAQIKAPTKNGTTNVFYGSATEFGTDLLTLIELHNKGTQICLAATTDDKFVAMWSYDEMSFSTPITSLAFTYLCANANAHTNIWFDFEMHECDDSTLDIYMQAFPHVKHV